MENARQRMSVQRNDCNCLVQNKWCLETAKANGLNVYTYLEYLLLYMPDTDWRNYPEDLDNLMPWSEAVQAECR